MKRILMVTGLVLIMLSGCVSNSVSTLEHVKETVYTTVYGTVAEARVEAREIRIAAAEAKAEAQAKAEAEAKARAEAEARSRATRSAAVVKRETYSANGDIVIKLSAVGDLTLAQPAFDSYYAQRGSRYFFSNVVGILSLDDITIGNLETTLSYQTARAEKYDYGNNFWFNGNPRYVDILRAGSVEVVNLANNHTYDYKQAGYDETRANLRRAGVGYFGYSYVLYKDLKGIRIAMLGFNQLGNVEQGVNLDEFKQNIANSIKGARAKAQLVIVEFHWGEEKQYQPDSIQTELARLSIDSGADLVLGAHPHVLQPVQMYKGKYIAYSLGNFCYGGNTNPADYDTMVFQESFIFSRAKELQSTVVEVIPYSISSRSDINDYRPTKAASSRVSSIKSKLQMDSLKTSKQDMVKVSDAMGNVLIDLKYATTDNFTGKQIYSTSSNAYLRRGTAEKLNRANSILVSKGYKLKIWDAYRPLRYQQVLWDAASDKSFIANPKTGSNHNRGAAVDVTLVTLDGKELNMPSGFDDMTSKAYRTYEAVSAEQKANALILENAMKASGFIPLPKEWWHFDDSEHSLYPLSNVNI